MPTTDFYINIPKSNGDKINLHFKNFRPHMVEEISEGDVKTSSNIGPETLDLFYEIMQGIKDNNYEEYTRSIDRRCKGKCCGGCK